MPIKDFIYAALSGIIVAIVFDIIRKKRNSKRKK